MTFNHVQCLNIAPMKKAWFIDRMEYSLNEKGIVAPMEYTSMVYSLKVKDMVL